MHVPPDAAGTCCGVPFSSKGYTEAHAIAANRAIERFWRWSDGGRLPVFVDTSPCTYGLLHSREALTEENRRRFDALKILDGVAFVHDVLLPKLTVTKKEPSAVLHPVCSLVKMGLVPKLEAVARACAENGDGPARRGLLRLRGRPRLPLPRADGVRDAPRGRGGAGGGRRGALVVQPHVRGRPFARDGRALPLLRPPRRAGDAARLRVALIARDAAR